MSLKGKNSALFSYNNSSRIESNFQYKDFEKTKSYNTNFSKSTFKGVSFRAAHMKFCNFSDCHFCDDDFVGSNLRGSRFDNAIFSHCIFVSCNMDNTRFINAHFDHCYIVGASTELLERLVPHNKQANNLIVLDHYPPKEDFNQKLLDSVEALRENDIIRRSNTLHCKNKRINTLTLMILKEVYSEDELISLMPYLPKYVKTQFYTVSYLKMLLTKIAKDVTI